MDRPITIGDILGWDAAGIFGVIVIVGLLWFLTWDTD